MSYSRIRRIGYVTTACAAVVVAAAVVVLVPASAQEPAAEARFAVQPAAVGAEMLIVTSPISRGIPISRGHILLPIPLWCNWPTPAPMPVPGQPTPVPPTPVPSPTPGGMASAATYTICSRTAKTVPPAVQQEALAEPWKIYGYNMRLNPNTPFHPLWNPLRTQLGLMNPNVAYHPCNPVVWKANCP